MATAIVIAIMSAEKAAESAQKNVLTDLVLKRLVKALLPLVKTPGWCQYEEEMKKFVTGQNPVAKQSWWSPLLEAFVEHMHQLEDKVGDRTRLQD